MYNKPITFCRSINGYSVFRDITHPLANKSGDVYYHRHVVSLKVGRWLKPYEQVHHIDGVRSNNHPDNLVVTSASEHIRLHLVQHPRERVHHPCLQCGVDTVNKKYCSSVCSHFSRRKVERPYKEELLRDLSHMSYCAVGRKYGVTDNAVRKWLR